jgi:cytochrome b561
MYLRDTLSGYGFVSRVLHWGMALAIVGVFGLGLWMVRLDYDSPYRIIGPDIHRSVGILLLLFLIARVIWRTLNAHPEPSPLTPLQYRASRAMHWTLYAVLLGVTVSGYFISSADGQPVSVFDWFSVPAVTKQPGLEDQAGLVHRWLAWGAIILAALHTIAALKHHFAGHDRILFSMWRGPSQR